MIVHKKKLAKKLFQHTMKKVRKIKFHFKHTLGSCASNNRSCNEVEEIIQGDDSNENSGDSRKNIHGKGSMALV